jgi:hypothetical protein
LAVTIWDQLSPEERVVLETALEEAHLNGVIGDFLGRPEHGGAVWRFSEDEAAIRALIPRFAEVVADMIRRDLVEIREPWDGVGDHAPVMTEVEVRAALGDPGSWVWTEGEAERMVMLMTTDHADRLLGRKPA